MGGRYRATRRSVIGLTAAVGIGMVDAKRAQAQLAPPRLSDGKVRIGVLTDMSGPYRDFAGPGSVIATQMAIEDFGNGFGGQPIELVSADHQNKPDVGSAIAREWFSVGGVDMIIDMPNSSVALAVQRVGADSKRIVINSSASTTDLTGKFCSPTGMHWTSDAYAQAHGTTHALVQRGDDTWFFLTVDYAGGHTLEEEAASVLRSEGGKVVGHSLHPLNSADFSSYLLRAQTSGAKVVALANAGNDTVNAIKQAAEFGLTQSGQKLVGLFVNITDVKALGLAVAKDLIFTTAFYWDQDEQTRAFAHRFETRHKAMPTQYQAGVYSATSHYLNAIKACGTDDGPTVAEQMRVTPVNDMFARNGQLREDGRMVHDMLLVQVKRPEQSKSAWDLLNVLTTIPAAQAFRPLSESVCKLVKA